MATEITQSSPVLRLLREAKALLQKGSCRGSFALDRTGRAVDELSPLACSWCLLGAIYAAGYREDSCYPLGTMYQAMTLLVDELPSVSRNPDRHTNCREYLAEFHDNNETVQPSIDLIDRAISELQAEQST